MDFGTIDDIGHCAVWRIDMQRDLIFKLDHVWNSFEKH
jgi:hypothetical protein